MSRCRQNILTFLIGVLILVWDAGVVHADSAFRQTNVDQAKTFFNAHGVPYLSIEGVGEQYNPAGVGVYAMAYAGLDVFDDSLKDLQDKEKFEAAIAWLKVNLSQNGQGLWVWSYHFDSTYNDVTIKAPWSSAFAQATGIQALLAHWRETQDESSLELARKAAEPLFIPLSEGGLLFSADADIWFEVIPSPVENPSHILNGHMRALLAIAELKDATGDARYQEWFDKGVATLVRWLPLYDAGYWLRYDLNPRKEELLFRLANPYGFANPELAIDRIVLRDPVSGEESVLDVGSPGDAEGPLRIAGNDWGQIEQVDGRSVRRLRSVEGGREASGSEGQMVAPYSYFYLKLPSKWQDNLRKAPYELSVEYLDEKPGNLEIQMRSISPGQETFRKLQDSDLLISGKGNWRQWKVRVNPSDLGYWVGKAYAGKHRDYLQLLAQQDDRLLPWAAVAAAYFSAAEPGDIFQKVTPKKMELPQQTPMLPIYSLDNDGVLMQHLASSSTRFDSKGMYDPSSDDGLPVYSPYIIASQLIDGPTTPGAAYSKIKMSDIQRAPALEWFKNSRNQVRLGEAVTYSFPFPNVYNDVSTSPPWPSAFSQAYVLKALRFALENMEKEPETLNLLKKSAYAYEVPVAQGGISSLSRSGTIYFEEVPNATHVLNAHLVSVPTLAEMAGYLDDARVQSLTKAGIETLRSELSQFDTGYWLRYDLNPKKELLFQLDWLSGDESPLIESISLDSPQFAKRNQLYVGSKQAFTGASRISGLEWLPVQQVDGRQARAFANGYLAHEEAVQGGARHNVYAVMQLPETTFSDYFDVQPHRLVIRYKDMAAGQFVVKLQSINEGNVLDFTPLRNAVITTTGDQQWKEAIVEVRPQDMGWYKGADYQVYEVEQLEHIAKLTGDWFFEQYAERQRYFLEAKAKDEPVIIQPIIEEGMVPVGLSVLQSSPTYEGFGFENALDGDPNDDYVAGLEGEAEEYVEMALDRPVSHALLGLRWESRINYARAVKVFALDANGARRQLISVPIENGEDIELKLDASQSFQRVRIEFIEPAGQPRVLLRLITLFASEDLVSQESSGLLKNMLEGEIYTRLRKYSPGPLFHEMTVDDALRGTEGNCSHTALWAAIRFDELGLPFRVLDVKSALDSGESLNHAMTEVFINGAWVLTDPLNGWFYPYGIKEMQDRPLPPINANWPGRPGHEVYKEPFFFRNLKYVESYEDLAYTGLFPEKRKGWRHDLIGVRPQ